MRVIGNSKEPTSASAGEALMRADLAAAVILTETPEKDYPFPAAEDVVRSESFGLNKAGPFVVADQPTSHWSPPAQRSSLSRLLDRA